MSTQAATHVPPVPQPGQVVEVRGARWAVTQATPQGLLRSPADEGRAGMQHVVSLQSIDEDRLGEELSVVWELEVGHTTLPDQGLPERVSAAGFDDPNLLGAVVDAVRWGAVTSADDKAFQAPFRSGAAVEAYQLEPLRRALSAPRTNLLLADDVGLGKTIEAGLVIQELLLRHRARTAIIVCPPSLAIKWQEEMREKFGLDFTIVDSACLADVRRRHGLAANPFRIFPRIIVSMAWLPRPRAQRLLRDVYGTESPSTGNRYAFDVLVVDEAHHVAPSSPSAVGGGRGYAVDSQRTEATRELARRCEHRLFLSATPHNGHSESFTALLEMIDDRRFQRGANVDAKALGEVTVRRLKRDIKEKNFKPRAIKMIAFVPDEDEAKAFDTFNGLLEQAAKNSGRKKGADIVSLILTKRFLSSPWAFGQTLEQYVSASATGRGYEDDEYAELFGSEQADDEEGLLGQPEFGALTGAKREDPFGGVDPDAIDGLVAWAKGYDMRADARVEALVSFLQGTCRSGEQTWNNERVVVFTEYADTLRWVRSILEQRGYDATRLAVIEGSTPAEDRETIRARFTAPPTEEPLRVLLATDAAGEGIDLQTYCHRLVNLDVPFNPSRLEQRIGRIDRYGQATTPEVFYFAPVQSSSAYAADLGFVRRIAEKVANIDRDLGSTNELIDDEIQQRYLPQRSRRAVPRDRNAEIVNKTLAAEQKLNQDLTRLARTYSEQKERLHLTPFNARRVVDAALDLSQEPRLRVDPDDLGGDEPETFRVDHLSTRWAKASEGLTSRLSNRMRPITFDECVAVERRDVVHVHLGHAIMQKSARLLRNSLFGSGSSMNRVTAVVDASLPESCVAAVARLVLVGRGGLRLHEEVFLSGVRLHGNQMAEEKVNTMLETVLDACDLQLAPEAVREALAARWNDADGRLRSRLEQTMQERADKRRASVDRRLAEREQADRDRAERIYAAFRRNLNESLDAARAAENETQLALLPDDQARQRRSDIRAMEARLDALDAEEQRELSLIGERYTEVRPFVSAAAVVFALTPADAAALGGTR